jgi:hypothetical protein
VEFAVADLALERAELVPQHLAEQLRTRALEQPLGFPVQVGKAPFTVQGIERVGDGFECGRQLLGDTVRLLFGLARGADVLDRAQVARAAVVRTQQFGAHAHLPFLTRGTHDPVPDVEPRSGVECRLHGVAHAWLLVRMHDLQEVIQAPGGRFHAADGAAHVRQGERHVAQVDLPEADLAFGLDDVRWRTWRLVGRHGA